MKIFVNYNDQTNELLGFYNDDIYNVEDIPDPKLEITDQQWQDALSAGANRFDGVNFSVEAIPPTNEDITRQAKNYLRDTNIFIIKNIEDGTPIPQSVIDNRIVAYAEIGVLLEPSSNLFNP